VTYEKVINIAKKVLEIESASIVTASKELGGFFAGS
jgi:hypothetical protein